MLAWYCFDEAYRPTGLAVRDVRIIGKATDSTAAGLSAYCQDNFVIRNIYAQQMGDYVAGGEYCRNGYVDNIRGLDITNPRWWEFVFYSENIHARNCDAGGFYSHGNPVLNCSIDGEVVADTSLTWNSTDPPSAGDLNTMINWFENCKTNNAPLGGFTQLVHVPNPTLSQPFDPEDEGIPAELIS